MDQNSIACGNQLPPLSANYPWLVAQNLDGTGHQSFCTIHDQMCHYEAQIPELHGRRIRGYFHGWVILSNNNNNMWSLWNPVTSEIINLPPLTLNHSEIVRHACLSAPPDEPNSVLLLTIIRKPTFVFCQLGFKRDRLRWTKMPYIRQLHRILGHYNGFLHSPTCYNGKIYALCNKGDVVIQIDILLKAGEVLIKLSLFQKCPDPSEKHFPILIPLLKGYGTELFYIILAFNEDAKTKRRLANVYLFKWLMTSMRWVETMDIEDAIFFVDLACDYCVYYNHAVASDLGGYIHIRDNKGNMMYSYAVEDKTMSVSLIAYPESHVSLWECRPVGDHKASELPLYSEKEEDKNHKIDVSLTTNNEVEQNESRLLNLPFDLLEMIIDRWVGVEYACFRATSKSCYFAAPLIQWSNKTESRRLQNYSLVSPWLMVVDKARNIISFTDPLLGDKYFIKRSPISIDRDKILCSRFGWLLFRDEEDSMLLFYNPITSNIRRLPLIGAHLDTLCFSAPPTSPDCMVVGFLCFRKMAYVYIHFVANWEDSWHKIRFDFGDAIPRRFSFPTFYGQDVYALCDKGEVYVFKNLFKSQGYVFKKVAGARSCKGEYFLVKRDQQFLLVTVGKFGEFVEVFKLNDYTKEWEKVECLGRYMICIADTTCLCIEAKVLEMENKIFFPRLHSKKGKIVFYSLETRRYHMFNRKNLEDIVGIGREHVDPYAWIEPAWC